MPHLVDWFTFKFAFQNGRAYREGLIYELESSFVMNLPYIQSCLRTGWWGCTVEEGPTCSPWYVGRSPRGHSGPPLTGPTSTTHTCWDSQQPAETEISQVKHNQWYHPADAEISQLKHHKWMLLYNRFFSRLYLFPILPLDVIEK